MPNDLVRWNCSVRAVNETSSDIDCVFILLFLGPATSAAGTYLFKSCPSKMHLDGYLTNFSISFLTYVNKLGPCWSEFRPTKCQLVADPGQFFWVLLGFHQSNANSRKLLNRAKSEYNTGVKHRYQTSHRWFTPVLTRKNSTRSRCHLMPWDQMILFQKAS